MSKKIELHSGNKNYAYFHCPGCDDLHMIKVSGGGEWKFNFDFESPTISPSVLLTKSKGDSYRCHSFVERGSIRFLGDCSHDMKNQTVTLPDLTKKDMQMIGYDE